MKKLYILPFIGLLLLGPVRASQIQPTQSAITRPLSADSVGKQQRDSSVYRAQAPISLTNVIEQMNYCYMALTNIINSKSILQYQTELDQLLNNLTIENIADLDEIADFRENLMSATSDLSITEEERRVIRRLNAIQRDNAKYQALSNALSIPMMLIPGSGGVGPSPQMAFYLLLTAARAGIDYTVQGNQLQAEELQSMWELKKRDLETYKNLRIEAFRILVQLYKKYNLKEQDRLTEQTAQTFSRIIQEADPAKRLRLLLDNKEVYASLIDWEYYVGMAYADVKQVNEAYRHLHTYINRRQSTPLFRTDSKLGLAALAMISYNPKLDRERKLAYLKLAKDNLPDNGANITQIALQYQLVGEPALGFELLRSGLDNENLTDKDLLLWAVMQGLPQLQKRPEVASRINKAVSSTSGLGLESYLNYLLRVNAKSFPQALSKLVSFSDETDDDIKIRLQSDRLIFDPSRLEVYRMVLDEGDVDIKQLTPNYVGAIGREALEKEFPYFAAYPKAIPLVFQPIKQGTLYKLRSDIEPRDLFAGGKVYNRMLQGFGGISSDELSDLIDYCKEHQKEAQGILLECADNSTEFSMGKNRFFNYYLAQKKGYQLQDDDATYDWELWLNPEKAASRTPYFSPLVVGGVNGLFIVLKWSGARNLILTYKYNPDAEKLELYCVQQESAKGEVLEYNFYESNLNFSLDSADDWVSSSWSWLWWVLGIVLLVIAGGAILDN